MILNCKLVMLGNTSVGKSSLVKRFAHGNFFEFEEPTIGAAFVCKDIVLDDKKIKVEIWDTAGQERYKSLTPMYFRNANIALIVFDLTNKDSFNGVEYWINTLEEKRKHNICKILVGNKKDMENIRTVTNEEIEKYKNKYNILYFETSAKNGVGVDVLFDEIFKQGIINTDHSDADIMKFNEILDISRVSAVNDDNNLLCC